MALTYGQARRILMEWNGGQDSAVYSVGSSGKMVYARDAELSLERDLSHVRLAGKAGYDDPVAAERELTAVIEWLRVQERDIPRDEWVNAWDETEV